ncbi:MAG TPA: hypothetical protein VJR94_10315 [Candidatus Nitrosocosmicus sp.]|nr:hypothetical protein [Candidatus Nitrosocosmicus sp.]
MAGTNRYQIRYDVLIMVSMLCLSVYTVNPDPFHFETYSSISQDAFENKETRDQYNSSQCPDIVSDQTTSVLYNLQKEVPKSKNAQKNDLIHNSFESAGDSTINNNRDVGIWFYANFYEHTPPVSIIDQFVKFDINTIYFAGSTTVDWQDPDKFRSFADFICYAYSKGLNVYAVTLEDPFFAFAKEKEIQNAFANFIKSTKGLFETFMVDVEPHTLHLADPLLFVPQYIRMSLILQNVANHHNVTYVDTVPYWYHSVIKNIGISSGIDILGGNEVNFMDYSYSFNQSITNINKIMTEIKKPFTISIKVTPGYGDPYLNELELTKTINYLQNNSIPYGIFESQYLLRNMHDLSKR